MYFDDLSNLTFNFQKNIFHLKNQLIEELEITQKDVRNFKEEQIEIIWDWVKK